jgi:hypothetical protein
MALGPRAAHVLFCASRPKHHAGSGPLSSNVRPHKPPMPPLKPAAQDLPARQPVWEALSELFLDTDTSVSRQWRADQLAGSPYSLEQLEFILVDEVYPVCKYNLLSVAGEWAGFNQEWLQSKILRRLGSRLRFLHGLNLGRLTVPASEEWQATKVAIVAARSTNAKSAA